MPSLPTSCSLPGFPGHHVICSPEAGMSPGRGLALNVLTAAGRLPPMEPTRRQGTLNHLPPGFLSGRRGTFFLLADSFSVPRDRSKDDLELGVLGSNPSSSSWLGDLAWQISSPTWERMRRLPSPPWEPRGPRVSKGQETPPEWACLESLTEQASLSASCVLGHAPCPSGAAVPVWETDNK